MTTELVVLPAGESIDDAVTRIGANDHSMYPVVDERGGLLGLVSELRLKRRSTEGHGAAPVESAAREESCLRSDLPLVDAVARMSASPHARWRSST